MYRTKRLNIAIAILLTLFGLSTQQSIAQDELFDGDAWINEEGNAEMTPAKAIDNSKIVSDWKRRRDTMPILEARIKELEERVDFLVRENEKQLTEIEVLNRIVFEKNQEADSLADESIKTAKGLFSRLSFRAEGVYVPTPGEFELNGRIEFRISKFYLLGEGTARRFQIEQFSEDRFEYKIGLGYRFN